jgi:N-acetylmuramoyl-L-alanine amidase
VRSAFLSGTQMPTSTYDGVDGIAPRDNLAGLNLSTVPVVFIECGKSPQWQQLAGEALAQGITRFLTQSNN